MKKIILVLPIFLILALAAPVSAAKNEIEAQEQSPKPEAEEIKTSPSPTDDAETLDEDSASEESTEGARGEGLLIRSQTALTHMSEVAKQVQLLLQTTVGGIGEQVRVIAQAQNKAQEEIDSEIGKLKAKSQFARFLTGSNYGAVKSIKQIIAANELRIEQLTKLAGETTNQGLKTRIQATIQTLTQQNVALTDLVTSEERVIGLFGWFTRLFQK